MRQSLRTLYDVRVVASDLDHCECVNFGPDGAAYAGSEAGVLFRIDAATGGKSPVARTAGPIGGVCVDGASNVYACTFGPAVRRISPDGAVTDLTVGVPGMAARVTNYAVFGRDGSLYYSDSGAYFSPSGRLFVVRPDGRTEHLFGDHMHCPNGLAIDPEGRYLYCIQSTAADILRLPLGPAGVGAPEIFFTLPGTVPDGLAFGAGGNLYVACYKPDAIYRITPDRHLECVVEDPTGEILNRPTNVAFVPGQPVLMVANLGGTTLVSVTLDEGGMPLHHPRL